MNALKIIKINLLLGAIMFAGFAFAFQSEAYAARAVCKTIKGLATISKSKSNAKRLAYQRCAKYATDGWVFLNRRVKCQLKRYHSLKSYHCRCIARLCKKNEATPSKTSKSKKVKETEKKSEPEEKAESQEKIEKAKEPEKKEEKQEKAEPETKPDTDETEKKEESTEKPAQDNNQPQEKSEPASTEDKKTE